ncbi:flagellar transcriptional activator FlhC [Variovorax soli]|mgnify:CR=1 FL=1|uniref:Flagellar transcriptional regulator FlhC n=2 Tax=Variovorax soli TaxID=376815 RepID=A0ABU1NFT3_9BURK|nr:flagellar transcriptional activator FlhC [Variovorax soli]
MSGARSLQGARSAVDDMSAPSAGGSRATQKSVLREVREVQLAIELIELGARLQFLEAEVDLSRERLIRLYKELRGVSPPKGLLPFSTDWYMTWLANIHSSMFYNMYQFMLTHANESGLQALIKSYRLYMEQIESLGGESVLDFTRAYTMVRFFNSDMLQLSTCCRCGGRFVAHAHDSKNGYVCVLCRPPSRAGKVRGAKRACAGTTNETGLQKLASPADKPEVAPIERAPQTVLP